MAFCMKCGTEIPAGSAVCPKCGTPVGAPQQMYQPAPAYKNDYTDEMPPQDIERGRALAALSYFGIMFSILALVAEPNNKFVRFHVNQSLVLQICGLLSTLCAIVPFLGWIVAGIANIVFAVFAIIGLFNAKAGRAKEVPAVGKYRPIK